MTLKLKRDQRLMIVLGIVVAVLVAGGLVIALAFRSATAVQGADFDYASIPQSRTDDGAYVLGDPNAPITLVEFADFRCGGCQQYKPVMRQFIQDFVLTGQAKFEFRYFQTADATGQTMNLVECTGAQDPALFWPAHDVMFTLTTQGMREELPRRFAQQVGVNYAQLLTCARSQGPEALARDVELGRSLGLTVTPSVVFRNAQGRIVMPTTGSGQPYTGGALQYPLLLQNILALQMQQGA